MLERNTGDLRVVIERRGVGGFLICGRLNKDLQDRDMSRQ